MTITTVQNETILITGAPALDPVTVVFRDAEPRRGGIIIECYGKAWAAFWGAMGDQTVKQFVAKCDADYLANSLHDRSQKRTKQSDAYLRRIATAVILALRRLPDREAETARRPAAVVRHDNNERRLVSSKSWGHRVCDTKAERKDGTWEHCDGRVVCSLVDGDVRVPLCERCARNVRSGAYGTRLRDLLIACDPPTPQPPSAQSAAPARDHHPL